MVLKKSQKETIAKLELFKDFLAIMNTSGASILNNTHLILNFVYWSDASSHGLGGFNHEGLAW